MCNEVCMCCERDVCKCLLVPLPELKIILSSLKRTEPKTYKDFNISTDENLIHIHILLSIRRYKKKLDEITKEIKSYGYRFDRTKRYERFYCSSFYCD